MVVLLAIVPGVFAEIIVFENYDTTFEMKGDTLVVKKDMRMKNVGVNPIIPGEIHFRLSEEAKEGPVAPSITNFAVFNSRNDKVDSRQLKSDKEVDLIFTIWDPLLPQFHYDFVMEYEIKYDVKGILFYQITIPEEKTTIPIKGSSVTFRLPDKYHVTYAPDAKIETQGDTRVLSWEQGDNLRFEYSPLPLPKTGMQMVNIFWITVIVIFLVVFVLRIVLSRKGTL
ncbi:hypothetical protein H6504_00845 [Candidatus Woesearchaeota archaeon]|nr:hypothetical protein [Candidatus Woesearchaeota archaeon]